MLQHYLRSRSQRKQTHKQANKRGARQAVAVRTLLAIALPMTVSTSYAIDNQSIQSVIQSSNTTGTGVNFSVADAAVTGTSVYSARGLPPGVSIDASSGRISGTLLQRGVYAFTVTQSNSGSGESTQQKFRWLVADSTTGTIADENGVVPGQYIVAYRPTQDPLAQSEAATAALLQGWIGEAQALGGIVGDVYSHALVGISATLSDAAVAQLRADADVLYVTPVIEMRAIDDQANATWGLDRVDQRNLPLNTVYSYSFDGSGVDAYVIDTGILGTHSDFGGRVVDGHDEIGGGWTDCNGHGTHVAGTVGGSQYGVAKNVNLIAVRVLDCNGSGFNSGVIAGVDWAVARAASSGRPSVGNMSLGGGFDQGSNDAVRNAVEAGVVMVLAAGNNNGNACATSPASEPTAFTVAATDRNDQRAGFSNFGSCVDIHGPGVSITSAWHTGNTATNTISGTSMASPHGAGIAALYMQGNPNATAPAAMQALAALTMPGVASDPAGSPNLLMFSDVTGANPGDPGNPGGPGDPDRTIFFNDDFESTDKWQQNPGGVDTATTGQWQRGTPQQTSENGVIMQPATSAGGSFGMFTNPLAGASVGENDIDGGVTSAESDDIAVPAASSLRLSFDYFLAHTANATADDYLRVFVVDGTNAIPVLQAAGAPLVRAHQWRKATVSLDTFDNRTIRLRIEAADAGTPSLVEAGLDNIVIDGVSDDGGDGEVTISVADQSVNEDDGVASVAVSLSQAASVPIEVTVFTRPGSAINGRDFYGDSQVLNFAAGETSKLFEVGIIDDILTESAESLNVRLAQASGATISDGEATVTIVDDDASSGPLITLTSVQVSESAGTASVQISLSEAAPAAVTLRVFTQAITATPGSDYYGKTESATFAAGETAKTFSFDILDDSVTESEEQVLVRINNVSGAGVQSDRATVSIDDND